MRMPDNTQTPEYPGVEPPPAAADDAERVSAFPRSRVGAFGPPSAPAFDLRTLSLTTAAPFLNAIHYAFLSALRGRAPDCRCSSPAENSATRSDRCGSHSS